MSILRQGPGVFFAFCAFVLLIVVSVGNPIWDAVRFLTARVGGAELRLGQWGYTISGVNGLAQSSGSSLGYRADQALEALGGDVGDVSGAVTHGLTYALVLHPIAAGLTLLTILMSLGTSRIGDICGSLFAFFTFLVCLVALIIDSVLFVVARNRINTAYNGSPANLSNAYWLVVASTILLFLASLTICFGSRHARRQKRQDEAIASQPVYAQQPVMQENRRFWQRNRY